MIFSIHNQDYGLRLARQKYHRNAKSVKNKNRNFISIYVRVHICTVIKRIVGVMVSVLASRAIECEFEPRSDQSKDYKISVCCLSVKHTALRKKSKDWLVQNQDKMSKETTCLPADCYFIVLVQYKAGIISMNVTCSRHDITEILSYGVKQQSLHHLHS